MKKQTYTEEQVNGLLEKINELKDQRDQWVMMAARLYELPSCKHFPDWKKTLSASRGPWGEDCPVCLCRKRMTDMVDELHSVSSAFSLQPSALPQP